MNNNEPTGRLTPYRLNRLIVAALFSAIGSFAVLSNRRRYELLAEVFGPLTGRLPVAFRSIDSAEASKAHKPATVDHATAAAQGAVPVIYQPSTITELIAAAEATIGTRELAVRLRQIPERAHTITSSDGCAQQPGFGAALWLANFAMASDSIRDGLLRTRDTALINECRAAGYEVRTGREIPVIRTVNLGASTGSGPEIWDALRTKVIARDLGCSARQYLFALMPSANITADPEASRQIAGRFLLELANAQAHPDKVRLPTFDGRSFTWSDGPIYDGGIYLVGVGNDFMAAGNREELAYRLALLAVAQVCTPYLAQAEGAFVDSVPAQGDGRIGLPAFSKLGIARAYSCDLSHRRHAEAAATRLVSTRL